MKKTLLLAFAIVISAVSNNLFSQVKEIRKIDRPRSKAPLEAEVIDNVVLDARAKKHYPDNQLKSMPTVKKIQVNYLYQESFILDPENQYTSSCRQSIKDEVDVALYNNQRDETKRVKILIDEKCKLSVILLSWEEVRAQNEKIAANSASQK